MSLFRRALVGAALVLGLATAAPAATIPAFNRATNDGVFSLSSEQAAWLGAPDADRIGFLRIRSGGRPAVTWSAGDIFTADTLLASATRNGERILGFVNGERTDALAYAGDAFRPFTSAAFLEDASKNDAIVRAVAFLFSSDAGAITFAGSATFNGAQTRGASDIVVPAEAPAPVPLPAAGWLLLGGLGGLALLRRRARA